MNSVRDNAPAPAQNEAAFSFVQALAAELSSGKVYLPGFPDIAMRVQRVLANEDVPVDRIVRVIGSEPVLASQLLRMANSAALDVSRKSVTDLKTAVTRVGINVVRSATIAFAVRQLRSAPALKSIEKPLALLWERSVMVACLSFVVAKRFTSINPDTAMLTGLLHGIGRLYILTRASRHRSLFADVSAYQTIERDWHVSIATAILENWEIADEIVAAVRDCEDLDREARGAPNLTDVLVLSNMLSAYSTESEILQIQLQSTRSLARLLLTQEACLSLLQESEEEIAGLRAALN